MPLPGEGRVFVLNIKKLAIETGVALRIKCREKGCNEMRQDTFFGVSDTQARNRFAVGAHNEGWRGFSNGSFACPKHAPKDAE